MGQKNFPTRTILYSEARLEWLLEAVDELHGALSEGNLSAVTQMTEIELQSWLKEVVWVAQEALAEMENQRTGQEPTLALVRKSS
jgi:hypothetical protein